MWGQALKKAGAGRQLGQSIEGKILKRAGDGGEVIAQAKITNVAITHCPVNADTSLGFLAKSLLETAVEPEGYTYQTDLPDDPEVHMDYKGWGAGEEEKDEEKEEEEKTLTSESGAALVPESLESEEHSTTFKALNKAAAVSLVLKRLPHVSCATAGRVVDLALQMKLKGLL